jgi:N-formylglutamate amidohydrolase
MTDWYTDELFAQDDARFCPVVFEYSRLVCDVERFSDDAREPMSARGMGAIYERTSDGRPLRNRMDSEARNAYLARYYNPHHRKLQELVDGVLARQQHCLIVDCHSFGTPLRCDFDQSLSRPDICIGTDSTHTPAELVRRIERACSAVGLSFFLNRPFAGTMVPLKHFGRDLRVKSVMIEVNRGLYIDLDTGSKLASFGSVREKIRGILLALRLQSE